MFESTHLNEIVIKIKYIFNSVGVHCPCVPNLEETLNISFCDSLHGLERH